MINEVGEAESGERKVKSCGAAFGGLFYVFNHEDYEVHGIISNIKIDN